ncbi:hypothetical protein ACQB6R_09575 [Propionibacteriaceae bacterium G1746]|uniref:hypothetical protein n=1 Tax=Aestuariimicrobium sp. G57 TaxID=3418485 RepID=UPI003C210349
MSADAREAVQQAYQAYIEHTLQAMVNFVGEDTDVDRLWVYTDMAFETITSHPFFRLNDQFVNHGELEAADPDHEHDAWALVDEIADTSTDLELVQACRDTGSVPQRIISVYDPESGELSASWDYEDVLQGEDDNSARALDRWIITMGGKPIVGQ